MNQTKTKRLRFYLKSVALILLVQFVLVNISASIYAYKFTHFYLPPAPAYTRQNVLTRTWRLFVGPRFYKDTAEAAPSFPCEHITLKTEEGIPIDAWYSTAVSSKGCVVLVHGYSANKSYLNAEAAVFRQWGYSLLLFDLRGHGKSGGNTTTFGMKETDELGKAVAYARKRGESKIILYGVSLGSAVCLKAAAEGGVRPDAIIADVPFESVHEHLKARARILGFPAEPFAALTTAWIGMESGYNAFRHDIAGYAKKVTCPVLIEAGERDPFVSPAETGSIYRNLSSKNKKLVVYPEGGHGAFVQQDPLSWEKEITAFLGGV